VGVILFLLPTLTCAFAGEHVQEGLMQTSRADSALSRPDPDRTAQRPRVPTGRGLHVELGGRHAQYLHLGEPYQFNPVAALAGPTDTGWERQWREDEVWLGARYDFRVGDHLLFQPGIMLGAASGRFAASNAGTGYFEAWRTRLALLGGLSLAAELRADPSRGPFLMAQYQYRWAEAGEAHETLISGRDTNPDDRDAHFRWQESEAILGLGCRWGALRPLAGIAYTDFRLKKWLNHHIPESGVSGFDLEVVRALNSVASEYHFENKNPWGAFLELSWQASPTWALVAQCTLNGHAGYSVGMRVGF